MGLKGDFEEVARVWRVTPWRLRVWFVLSLVLASGSIASLAETVAKWKGFFLDAVHFYQLWISFPMVEALRNLTPLRLPAGAADVLVLVAIVLGANLRVAAYAGGPRWARPWALGVVTGTLSGVGLWLWGYGGNVVVGRLVIAILSIAAICSLFYVKVGGATRLLWFVYLFAPPALVAIAGAINAGLSR